MVLSFCTAMVTLFLIHKQFFFHSWGWCPIKRITSSREDLKIIYYYACLLDGNCLQSSVIYQATVTCKDHNTTAMYIGLTENDFKTRYINHTASFRHAKHRNSTELSKHMWTLKDNNIEHFISWCILSSHSPYSSSSKRCNLCLKEKFLIICQPEISIHLRLSFICWRVQARGQRQRHRMLMVCQFFVLCCNILFVAFFTRIVFPDFNDLLIWI